MVQKVTKNGMKIPARLRFAFHYGLAHQFDMPIVMTAAQLEGRPAEREAMYKSLERPVPVEVKASGSLADTGLDSPNES